VGVHVVEGALRRIKAHREQLDKRAEKAARPAPPAPAPAPSSAPAAAPAAAAAPGGLVETSDESVADATARQDYVRALLEFKVDPSWYSLKSKSTKVLEVVAKREEQRCFRVLAAAAVGEHTQKDGAEGLPPFKLGQMLCVLMSWDDGVLTLGQAAYLAGVPYPFASEDRGFFGSSRFHDQQAWLWSLPDEHANRMALVMLAAQEPRGKDNPIDHFGETVLLGCDLPPLALLEDAQAAVRHTIQLGAAQHGQQTAAPAAPAKRKPGTKQAARPDIRYRNAATGETWSGRGLQPRWLKAALANGAKITDFDLHAGGGL
jgi:hypothetical protein